MCESASPGVYAVVELGELHCDRFQHTELMVDLSVPRHLGSLLRLDAQVSLSQLFLHHCNLFGWDCSSTNTGDKVMGIVTQI